MVRVVRLERTVSWSQTRRDTNFAIPGYSISAMIPRQVEKSKIFLSVVIYVVKAAFVPFWQRGKVPQTPVLQGFAAFRPDPSRIRPRHTQTVCGNLAYYTSFLRVLQEGETLRMGGICRTTIHIEQEYNTRHGLQAIQ